VWYLEMVAGFLDTSSTAEVALPPFRFRRMPARPAHRFCQLAIPFQDSEKVGKSQRCPAVISEKKWSRDQTRVMHSPRRRSEERGWNVKMFHLDGSCEPGKWRRKGGPRGSRDGLEIGL